MSALTDYFTALAGKIRKKLNNESTYTPATMITAIDDIYTKGKNDGIAQQSKIVMNGLSIMSDPTIRTSFSGNISSVSFTNSIGNSVYFYLYSDMSSSSPLLDQLIEANSTVTINCSSYSGKCFEIGGRTSGLISNLSVVLK